MVGALLHELELQKDYLSGAPLDSIYFGGGTPSILEASELGLIFDKIQQLHDISPKAEITLEANPDDLSNTKIQDLRATPINRFSIGVQSFFEEDLQFMNRAHNAQEADYSIKAAQDAGFNNITIDLIYGSPTTSDKQWQANIDKAIGLQVPHLSCYCLTVEPKTALGNWVSTGKVAPLDDAQAVRQFDQLMDSMEKAGFLHYEISNYAQPGYEAIHNSNYWNGVPYLGIGPSAHSFNGTSRQWNIANNMKYLKAMEVHEIPAEVETLTLQERYNEYVMTALRTSKGVLNAVLEGQFGDFISEFDKEVKAHLELGHIEQSESGYHLTRSGKHLADQVAASFFVVED